MGYAEAILAAIQAAKAAIAAYNELAAVANAKGDITDAQLQTIVDEGAAADKEMAARVAAAKKRLGIV